MLGPQDEVMHHAAHVARSRWPGEFGDLLARSMFTLTPSAADAEDGEDSLGLRMAHALLRADAAEETRRSGTPPRRATHTAHSAQRSRQRSEQRTDQPTVDGTETAIRRLLAAAQ